MRSQCNESCMPWNYPLPRVGGSESMGALRRAARKISIPLLFRGGKPRGILGSPTGKRTGIPRYAWDGIKNWTRSDDAVYQLTVLRRTFLPHTMDAPAHR